MKVLQESALEQSIYIIPRVYSTNVVAEVRDSSTNDVHYYYIVGSLSSDYLILSDVFNLTQNRYFDLVVYNIDALDDFHEIFVIDNGVIVDNPCEIEYYFNNNKSSVIYRDKIFCTNQVVNQLENEYYSVNDEEYKEHSSNNDYIILE